MNPKEFEMKIQINDSTDNLYVTFNLKIKLTRSINSGVSWNISVWFK